MLLSFIGFEPEVLLQRPKTRLPFWIWSFKPEWINKSSKKTHYFEQFWKALCFNNLRARLSSFVNMGKKGKSTATSTPTEAQGSESQAISATEITRKRQTRTAYRRSTKRLMETANEALQFISENPSSLSDPWSENHSQWETRTLARPSPGNPRINIGRRHRGGDWSSRPFSRQGKFCYRSTGRGVSCRFNT